MKVEKINFEKLKMQDTTQLIEGHIKTEFVVSLCGLFSDGLKETTDGMFHSTA